MTALVVDTNLLCLLVVGNVGPEWIGRHKRLAKYGIEDHERVRTLLLRFGRIIVCPHVLTECSNIARLSAEPLKTLVGAALQDIVAASEELHLAAQDVCTTDAYLRLGLTDAVLLLLAAGDHVLISDDLDLYLAAEARGLSVINYNYLRDGLTLDAIGTY